MIKEIVLISHKERERERERERESVCAFMCERERVNICVWE